MSAAKEQIFYILSPHKIEAIEYDLPDFLPDDIRTAIELDNNKTATDEVCLDNLKREYPKYHTYRIRVDKL